MKQAVVSGKAAGSADSVFADMRKRLFETRYVLLAALPIAIVLAFTPIGPGWAATGFVILVVAALLPVRSRLVLLAEERRRDEAELERQSAARDALLDAIDLPAFLLAGDGSLIHANRTARQLFGPVTPGGHLSSRIRSPEILDMVREALEKHEPASLEHSERVPSERWYQVRIAPAGGVPDGTGLGNCFLLTFRDLTEARRMDRMRSDFVANASHELRTPLASLTGFIETLQGPAREDARTRDQFLAIMLDQAGRMSRLVDDLLSLSRLELRAHVAPSGTIDLRPLLVHVCDALRPLAAELGVAIRFDAPDGPVNVSGERDELIQVFQNLVENACKYGQSGGAVDVTIVRGGVGETPEGMVDVSVRDYGPGIASEHVPRLTERFYRVDVESSRSKKGTGLGLAIVKHILTRHRARLMIRSELGKGSVFTVRFSAS